nr:hypothetical protein [uncultured Campylobacter sp.]
MAHFGSLYDIFVRCGGASLNLFVFAFFADLEPPKPLSRVCVTALAVASSARNLRPRTRPNRQTACRLQSNLTVHFCFYDSVASVKFEPVDALSNLNLTLPQIPAALPNLNPARYYIKFGCELQSRQISAILRRGLST